MPRVQLDAEDLAKVKVSSSWGPFNEALVSLTLLQTPRRPSVLVDRWRQEVRAHLDDWAAPLLALARRQGLIDLHTVVGDAPSLDEALEQLKRVPDEHLRLELAYLRPTDHGMATWAQRWWRDLSDGDRRARQELAQLISRYHTSAIDPHWRRVAAYLEAERARYGRVMATDGVGCLLATLHPKIRWQPPFLDINVDGPPNDPAGEQRPPDMVLGGRSLVLAPSVFCQDRPWLLWNVLDDALPVIVLYPALRNLQDAATIWMGDAPRGRRALARLLGPTRADALDALADTSTTTGLARRLGVSPATASHHLGILRDAKLIDSHRAGSAVRHRLTDLGAALLDGSWQQRSH